MFAFALAALCIDSFSIVPSTSFAPNSWAIKANFTVEVAQYALIFGILSSKIRETAYVFKISFAVTGSFTFK